MTTKEMLKIVGCSVAVVFACQVLMGALTTTGNVSVGGCKNGTTTEVGDEEYIWTGGKTLQIQFEPDADAAATDAEVTLYACTEQDAESCVLYEFDSDFNGVPDTAILDGDSLGQRGIEVVGIAGYLRVYTSTAPVAADDVAMWWVCGVAEGL